MKVRDKNVKQLVDVSDEECPKRECYWPRPDPGVFTQGVGYRTRYPGRKPDWLCGNREISGCPAKYCHMRATISAETRKPGKMALSVAKPGDGMEARL